MYNNKISELIFIYDLKPADVFVAHKKIGLSFDHYIVYLGKYNGQHQFAANLAPTVQILTPVHLDELSTAFAPIAIRKFTGTEFERREALNRAYKKFKKAEPYRLLKKNCQHYANYVQMGTEYSEQSSFGHGALATVGFTTAIVAKDPVVQFLGLLFGVVETVNLIEEESNRPTPQQKRLVGPRQSLIQEKNNIYGIT